MRICEYDVYVEQVLLNYYFLNKTNNIVQPRNCNLHCVQPIIYLQSLSVGVNV